MCSTSGRRVLLTPFPAKQLRERSEIECFVLKSTTIC